MPMSKKLSFYDSRITFATNHQKSNAAREPFRRIARCSVEELGIDSDSLGTFSGEVERVGSMIDALRAKVALAREKTTNRFVLVSEGSFTTAGGFGLVAQGIEMLMLHDSLTGAEVLEQHISWDTNYLTTVVRTHAELDRFLEQISFGSQALVLYPQRGARVGDVKKGIVDRAEALRAFDQSLELSPEKAVVAMSDMRAHLNPTRMRAIAQCCERLAMRLVTECPGCGSGGFGLVSTVPGLPCEECGYPTPRAKAETHSCVVCGRSEERPRGDGKKSADSSECERCNP